MIVSFVASPIMLMSINGLPLVMSFTWFVIAIALIIKLVRRSYLIKHGIYTKAEVRGFHDKRDAI